MDSVEVTTTSGDGVPTGNLSMMERDKIKMKDVLHLLDITKDEAIAAAKYCNKHCISGLCCECPHQVHCRTVDQKLMLKPIMNGKEVGAWFMSDLIYQNGQLREEYR